VTVIDETRLNGLQILRQLGKIIRDKRPDIIHTHRTKENILGSIAARFNGNVPSLRTAHGAPEHYPAWYQLPKRMILLMDRFCGCYLQHRIIAVSEDLAGILTRNYPAEKIHVIENGIDTASLDAATSRTAPRPRGQRQPCRIGIAGRLVPVKRVDLFIRAAHQFVDDNPELPVSFHIYGDGPLKASLQSLSQQLATGKYVHFEGHTDDIHNKLAGLDALLMTSDHEGLPMVLLEAMALKVPVIAHAVGGIPMLLDSGKCGFLVTDHAPSGYARAIKKLLDYPGEREEIIKCAWGRVTSVYSAQQNARSYNKVYESIIHHE
jgi:glycosyltransferase involved in cell wall biosynthesis